MPTSEDVLRCKMGENDADAENVGEYLVALLYTLWDEDEGFSGKRPLGNSDWQWTVYKALGKQGLVVGMVIKTYRDCEHYEDEDPCECNDTYEEIEEFPRKSEQEADRLIMKAIKNMDRVTW